MARTRKNKSKGKNAASGGDPEAPTVIEWESMEIYRKFIVTENAIDEEEDVDHPFEVGDCVSILPSNLPAGYRIEDGPALPIEAMWLGLIKDIRMRYKGGEQEAWCRVQWFFSGADVGNTIQNFDTSHLGENERLLSDHCDLVHSSTLDGVVPMRRFNFDPTYIPSVERNTTLQQMFTQKEIRAAGSRTENGSIYPDVYYRYELKVKSKHIFPNVSQFNCFSPEVSTNSSRPRSSSRSKSNRRPAPTLNTNISLKSQQHHNICFSESSYSPPDSERARRIGRQVADLVREAHIILEDGITQILKSASESKLTNEFKKNLSQVGDMARTTGDTVRTTRARTGTSNVDSEIPASATQSSEDLNVSLNKTANQLASKMQEAILLEDTLAMHICARAQCTAPRGKAWHRSCLIRDQAPSEKGVEGGAEDFSDNDDTLLHLESWILRDARRRGRTHPMSSPSFDHVIARWKAMGHSRQLEVERMLQLLCTIPPGYEHPSIGSEGIYEFPVLFTVSIPSNAKPSAVGKSGASGKRKARTSDQEELEVSAGLLDLDKGSKSPKKQRRSLRVSDADKLNIEPESAPRYSKDDDEEDYIPRIMHTLSSLLAPELICLASQPMVRGGVPSISSPASRNHSFAFAGTSPIFSSESLFGEALRTTITGNISEVARARIAVYKALDEMSLQPKKPDSSSAIDVDITKKEPLIVPQEWSEYVFELEGREWLFELYDSASTSKRREKRFVSSKDKIRETVLTRTHNFLRFWQAHRRTMMLCPTCKFDI
ncbi:hypothetical protein F5876DRAFT_74339 [Lentinula aff. lateritia]|uniref:Uncharacterized protein n=1 Tax=Lentinula aff. lateritia TaxID=2804960 RepID=A0ACC1U7L7_9AGAR|nr:hypothetical protein F5876DRAFT_74339 [Lentinula aff. lateritia]